MKFLFTFLLFFTMPFTVIAQVPFNPAQAQAELDKRGISEAEIRQKLLEKGIDLDKIDPSNPREVAELQKATEEAIAELEQEKANQNSTTNPTSSPKKENIGDQINQAAKKENKRLDQQEVQNITESVNDGASVEEAISEELSEKTKGNLPPVTVYGQQIFRNQSLKLFSTVKDVKPPDSYVLGAGDEIGISIFGISQGDFALSIDEDGYIKPGGLPRILLKGITYGKAKKLLQSRFRQYYVFNNGQFAMTINAARTISVNIFGEVNKYGSFTVSAINTAINALVAAGGPSDIGTLRNIQLIRNGKSKRIDVYEFMQNPSQQYDFFLENNDIIHIPVQERVVSIQGAVKRPMRYELIDRENLIQLIEYAGGLTDNAYRNVVQIKRFVNNEEVILDIDLKNLQAANRDYTLLSGDVVSVKDIPKPYQNYVEINGAVELPGKYQLTTNMKVSDLLNNGEIKEEARTDIAFLLRTNPDKTVQFLKLNLENIQANPNSSENITLQPKDNLSIYTLEEYVDKFTISISGAVRNPSEHPYDSSNDIKVQEAVLLAGGLKQDALDFAYIIRKDTSNQQVRDYIRINVQEAINNPNSSSNRTLQPFDELKILSQTTYADISTIRISGAVRNPGEFQYDSSLSLQDALILAGGLTLEAAANRIDIFRVEINDNQPTKTIAAQVQVEKNLVLSPSNQNIALQAFDQVVVRAVPDFEFQKSVLIEGEVKYPGQYALLGDNERLLSVLKRAGGLTPEAFVEGVTLYREEGNIGIIITQIEEILDNPNSPFNYLLKKGDIVTIPKNKDLVTINVKNTKASELYPSKILGSGKINIAYQDNKNAKWYVTEYAAGVTKEGSSARISVEHPNGAIKKTKDFGLFKIYPKVKKGSIISIGIKPKKEEKKEKAAKESVDWEKVIANSLAQVSAVLTLVLLVQQINK